MKIISRYVLQHLLPVFGLALLAFVGLYLIIDFFEKGGRSAGETSPSGRGPQVFPLQDSPGGRAGHSHEPSPGTLIALGILKRNRELIALRAAGIHTIRYAGPIVAAALVVAALYFGVGETLATKPEPEIPGHMAGIRPESQASPILETGKCLVSRPARHLSDSRL